MAQKTFTSAVLDATDINTYLAGEGGAWTTWTPTVTQSGSVSLTNTRSRYARYGRTIHASVDVVMTGSGTSNNAIAVSLPVAAAAANSVSGGGGYLYDSSTGVYYPTIVAPSSTTACGLLDAATASATPSLGVTGSSFGAALASGDIIRISFTYEAAS